MSEEKVQNPAPVSGKKKEMSTYVKYPLVLGIVCLVCGGVLGVVNYFTEDKIAQIEIDKQNAAMNNIMDSLKLTYSADARTELSIDAESYPNIDRGYRIAADDSNTYFYYQGTTGKGYSGTVTFGALVAKANYDIIGYQYISGTEDTIGIGAAGKVTVPYSEGGTIQSGASAKFTLPAIQKVFDEMIEYSKSVK